MKKLNLKICFFFAFASFQTISMDNEEKPTEFLFAAMGYYEQGEFEKSARIFKRYAGKPVPAAEPFCLDLVKKGYMKPFEPVLSNHEKEEEQTANMYFEAAQEFLRIKNKKSNKTGNKVVDDRKVLAEFFKEAKPTSSFLYLIGVLFESVGQKKEAEAFFIKAADQDLRAVLGLQRIGWDKGALGAIKMHHHSASKVCQAFSLMPVLHQDEGHVCATLSGFFSGSENVSVNFLKIAAQFGHANAQWHLGMHLRWKSNESGALYWLMQSAAYGTLDAVRSCGHMLECGKGTSVDYKQAYAYLERAAHHPDAKAIDFLNFAAMHETGRGTPVDLHAASAWFQKAYEADPNDLNVLLKYGAILGRMGVYREALPLLDKAQNFSDDAAYDYAVALEKSRPEEGGDLARAVSILSQLAHKGHPGAANTLVGWALDGKAPQDRQSLQTYKDYLDNAIQNLNSKRDSADCDIELSKTYWSLRILHEKEKSLFPEVISLSSLSEKAFQMNPQDQYVKFVYAKDLEREGSYKEALEHFLPLEKVGRPNIFNSIGACYDLLAKQAKKPREVEKLTQKALAYYQKEIGANGSGKALAAFNIYCLLIQERINPPFEGSLLHYLQMAADGGDEEALNDLGVAYTEGIYGVERDLGKAEWYLKQSAQRGVLRAKLNLMNLKFGQGAEEARKEANQLYNELWEEHPEELEAYLERLTGSVKDALRQEEKDDFSGDAEEAKEEKAEKDGDKRKEEEKEEERLAPAMFLKQPEEAPQPLAPALTKREKAEQEEKTRLQRKYQRLMERVEGLRGKKQVKYRKMQAIIKQHVDAFGGAVKSAKGSGRRIQVGDAHSGFHQPHGWDGSEMRGGALKSVAISMQQSHSSGSSSSSDNAVSGNFG